VESEDSNYGLKTLTETINVIFPKSEKQKASSPHRTLHLIDTITKSIVFDEQGQSSPYEL